MSKLSEAINGVTGAAAQLDDVAANLKAITGKLDENLLPQAEALIENVGKAADRLEVKATAVLGHAGELIEKIIPVVTQVRDGAWVEVKDLSFGGEFRIEGRVRIMPQGGRQ